MPSLRPITGSARQISPLLTDWVRDGGDPIVVRTSGSTGVPKEIALSHAAVLASARASLDRLGGPGQWLSALPVTGVGGLQVLVRSILADIEPVLADEYDDLAAAVAAMTGHRRYASLVPTQLFRLVEQGRASVLAPLDAVLLGGAAAPAALLARAADAGVTVVRTYGMTETCGGCVYDGVPLDGVRVRIVDGLVEVGGPMLAEGCPDWLPTHDLGEIDPDGRLRVLGRADDVAISGGVNVPLGLVEAVLVEQPGVAQVAVVAVPDAEWGERVVAHVVASDPTRPPLLGALRAAVEAAGHPRAWAPRDLVVVSELPLLAGGKIDKQALRAAFSSR